MKNAYELETIAKYMDQEFDSFDNVGELLPVVQRVSADLYKANCDTASILTDFYFQDIVLTDIKVEDAIKSVSKAIEWFWTQTGKPLHLEQVYTLKRNRGNLLFGMLSTDGRHFHANDGDTYPIGKKSEFELFDLQWLKDIKYIELNADTPQGNDMDNVMFNKGMFVYETKLDESWLACITDRELTEDQQWFMQTKVHMGL